MRNKKYIICLVFVTLFLNVYSQQDTTRLQPGDSLITGDVDATTHQEVYKLNLAVDIPIVAVGGGWSAFAFTKIYKKDPSTPEQIMNLDKNDINSFDRGSAGNWDEEADKISDYPFYASMPLPFFLLFDKEIRHDAGKIGLLYLEALAITGMIYTGCVYFVDRYRPQTYNTSIPVEDRTGGNYKDAFIAGHPALVATATFFTAKVYSDYNPDSKFKYALYGLAVGATGYTVYLRHIAGKHFPSDFILGVSTGILSGMLVPHFHKNKMHKDSRLGFMPVSNGKMHGFALRYSLK
ncbi:MAG: phosphatase PAP2 family protein [Bacteroidia bacterium]